VVVPECAFVTDRSAAFWIGVLAVGPAVGPGTLKVATERAFVAVVPTAPVAVALTVIVIVSPAAMAGAVHTYVAPTTHGTTVAGAVLNTKVTTPVFAFTRVPVTTTLVSGVASLL
jgi:hypothetical protein